MATFATLPEGYLREKHHLYLATGRVVTDNFAGGTSRRSCTHLLARHLRTFGGSRDKAERNTRARTSPPVLSRPKKQVAQEGPWLKRPGFWRINTPEEGEHGTRSNGEGWRHPRRRVCVRGKRDQVRRINLYTISRCNYCMTLGAWASCKLKRGNIGMTEWKSGV